MQTFVDTFISFWKIRFHKKRELLYYTLVQSQLFICYKTKTKAWILQLLCLICICAMNYDYTRDGIPIEQGYGCLL